MAKAPFRLRGKEKFGGLSKKAKAAQSEELRAVFEKHRGETEEHDRTGLRDY
jgi:ferritin-like metal-binding protein YciE